MTKEDAVIEYLAKEIANYFIALDREELIEHLKIGLLVAFRGYDKALDCIISGAMPGDITVEYDIKI